MCRHAHLLSEALACFRWLALSSIERAEVDTTPRSLADLPEKGRFQECTFSATTVHRPSRPMCRTPQVHDLPEARGVRCGCRTTCPSRPAPVHTAPRSRWWGEPSAPRASCGRCPASCRAGERAHSCATRRMGALRGRCLCTQEAVLSMVSPSWPHARNTHARVLSGSCCPFLSPHLVDGGCVTRLHGPAPCARSPRARASAAPG